jgi:hypothetical protein
MLFPALDSLEQAYSTSFLTQPSRQDLEASSSESHNVKSLSLSLSLSFSLSSILHLFSNFCFLPYYKTNLSQKFGYIFVYFLVYLPQYCKFKT